MCQGSTLQDENQRQLFKEFGLLTSMYIAWEHCECQDVFVSICHKERVTLSGNTSSIVGPHFYISMAMLNQNQALREIQI